MNKIILQVFFFLILFGGILFAHTDKIIEIEDGKLLGLPAKYNPAIISPNGLNIQINDIQLKFPIWFNTSKENFKMYDLKIRASWFHDLSILPPYIIIRMEKKSGDFAYEFFFNLETKQLYQINVCLKYDSGSWISHQLDMKQS